MLPGYRFIAAAFTDKGFILPEPQAVSEVCNLKLEIVLNLLAIFIITDVPLKNFAGDA